MRENTRPAWALLGAVLVLAVWCCGLFLAQRAGAFLVPVSVRWEGENAGVSPAELLRAQRYAREDGAEDQPAATLWREVKNQTLADPEGDAAATADVLEGFGDLDDLFPASFLAGSYPAREDGAGCAIDEALAHRLWGSGDVVGRSLRWNGGAYTVRGVLRGGAGLLLVQAAADSEEPLGRLLLRFPGVAGADEAASYLSRCGFPGGMVLDQPLLSWCLSALAALPGLLAALALLCRLWGRGWRLRHTPLLLCQYLPAALAGGAVTVWAAGFPWSVPDRLLPTRWADFAFWQRVWDQLAEGVRQALAAGLGRRDSAMWWLVLGCVLAAAVAAALVLPVAARLRPRTCRGLLGGALFAMGAVFALTVLFAPMGGLEAGRSLWLLPTLWLAGDLGLRVHGESLRPRRSPAAGPEEKEDAEEAGT